MGYTIKQKIDICLKAEANPEMTQADLASWAASQYGSVKAPSQTTISRILSSKNDLIATKDTDFQLVRRRKQTNPLLRRILTEWITQAIWENIPITTPIIQSTANAIWNRLPTEEKDGNGIFNQKWCNHFIKRLNINLTGTKEEIANNPGNHKLNKVWKLDEKIELKQYLLSLISQENYSPQDIFVLEEFRLFYSLPLDQIFDVSSIDKGLKQSSSSTENSLTIMLGCNIDGSEKLTPLVVGKYDKFDVSKSSHASFKNTSVNHISQHNLMNKITEVYQLVYKSNTNKWITSSMFQNYLVTLEHKLSSVSPNRKILILLDDSSSHRIINLKFDHIRLCYMKNNTNHKSPYNSLYNGVKFDYLPMNFGIIEEFKILYRLQQYLEMINLQRLNSKTSKSSLSDTEPSPDIDLTNYKVNAPQGMEVLSETDYHIPLIKVIEWIKRSWDSISPEKIFLSWKRTHLMPLAKSWPSNDPAVSMKANSDLVSLVTTSTNYNINKSYNKLVEIMGYLNVVIPWEIEELLGLVNEMGKVTLNYVSIEEIIGSCLSETFHEDVQDDKSDNNLMNDDSWYSGQVDGTNNDSASAFVSNSPGSLLTQAFATAAAGKAQSTGSPYGWNADFNATVVPATGNSLNDSTRLASLLDTAERSQPLSDAAMMPITPMDSTQLVNAPLIPSRKQQQQDVSALPPILSKFNSSPQVPTQLSQIAAASKINSPAGSKHRIEGDEGWFSDKRRNTLFSPAANNMVYPILNTGGALNDSLPPSGSPPPLFTGTTSNSGLLGKSVFSGISYKSSPGSNIGSYNGSDRASSPAVVVKHNDYDIMKMLKNLLEASSSSLKLSSATVNELALNLKEVEARLEQQSIHEAAVGRQSS